MSFHIGFDNEKYLKEQTAAITERVRQNGEKLYLEFGGKLLFDYHAARCLPGFDPNVKMRLLQMFRDQAEIIVCLGAGDVERRKIRADFGTTYDSEVLRLIDEFASRGMEIAGVVITRFEGQQTVLNFRRRLENRGVRVFTHSPTKGYPNDVDTIVSEEGYGRNVYIPTTRPIVVVTAPGPGSGKLATCLSQIYHDHLRGVRSGYAKYESFPVWNLPLRHPLNRAYEAATADLADVNLIDHFHLETYGERTVNYNRDLEAFPILRRILERITGCDAGYRSPTDMGVNRIACGIIDDAAVREASCQEIIRRYFRTSCEVALGQSDPKCLRQIELIMKDLDLVPERRRVVLPAREAAAEGQARGKGDSGVFTGAALELCDGTIVTGKNSPLLHSASSVVLNAAKVLAHIPDCIDLLPPNILSSLSYFKKEILSENRLALNLEETMLALSISAASNPAASAAVERLRSLRGCECHMTHIAAPGDEGGFRKLGVNLTCDPSFSGKSFLEA